MKAFLFALLISTSGLAQGTPPPVVLPVGEKTAPSMPPMFRYEQPEVYKRWWKEIAACSGVLLPDNLAKAVKFVAVNGESMVVDGDFGVIGYASAGTLTIYMVEAHLLNESLFKHEAMHMLLGWNGIDQGKNWHPRQYFDGVCGVTMWFEG